MTLLEKIDAYVASQGNQVGGGSEFADLLKEIVNSSPQGGNEPLIVKGIAADKNQFTPIDGHTFDEAKRAFKSGRVVLLDITDQDSGKSELCTVYRYNYSDSYLEFKIGEWWEDPIQ